MPPRSSARAHRPARAAASAAFRTGLRQRARAVLELEQRERAARFLAFPVQASGDHQVQHEVQIAVEVEHDAFSQSRETDDGFAVDIGKRGNRGPQQEGIEDTDRRQPLTAQQAFEAFDVDRDVGKLRHASMIRSACMSLLQARL